MSRGLLADERHFRNEYRLSRSTYLGHKWTGMDEVTLRRYLRDALYFRARWTGVYEVIEAQYRVEERADAAA